MSIGTFTLIKNEAPWIDGHIKNLLNYVDQMVFFDGNSTDGTIEIIKSFKSPKIILFENVDPKDLKDDYQRTFHEALRTLDTDLAFYIHPDMRVENPQKLILLKEGNGVAYFTEMISYGGEPEGQMYRIEKGRAERWKNIFRLHNPDLGAHYFGWYGAWNEDVYFSDITGKNHEFFGEHFELYPYIVKDSGLIIHHFSDVRPFERRLGRMKTCLKHQGVAVEDVDIIARNHPRVTLKTGNGFVFIPCEDPRKGALYV